MSAAPVPAPGVAEPTAPITLDELVAALRLGDSDEETAMATRLLRVAWSTVWRHAPLAPAPVQGEAIVRVAGFLFDMPSAPGGSQFANAMKSSGAAALLLPWRVHRLGIVRDA